MRAVEEYGPFAIMEETLTDQSKVYFVRILTPHGDGGQVRLNCADVVIAENLFRYLTAAYSERLLLDIEVRR